jgi:hypothetical protein
MEALIEFYENKARKRDKGVDDPSDVEYKPGKGEERRVGKRRRR